MSSADPPIAMQGLKGTKMAVVFVGIGVAVGVAIAFAIVLSQPQGQVFTHAVDDSENPLLNPDFLKTYQTSLRTGAYYKSTIGVGQETFFSADAKGGREPYSYEWKFSDGVVLHAQNSTRSFDKPGTYTFDMTVTDANGKTAGATDMNIKVFEEKNTAAP